MGHLRLAWALRRGAAVMNALTSQRLSLFSLVVLCAQPSALAQGEASHPITVTDATITEAIEHELRLDSSVRGSTIETEVNEGIAVLRGQVDDLLTRRRSQRIAEAVRGVRSVVNLLTVREIPGRDGADLARDVRATLLSDPLTEAREIEAEVQEGTVLLRGEVQSRLEKKLAGQVVAGVFGVRKLDNQLEVSASEARSDSEIAEELRKRLDFHAHLDGRQIEVSTDDGAVRLTGIVGSAAEKRLATGLAWTRGVRRVDSDGLKVAAIVDNKRVRNRVHVVRDAAAIRDAVRDALAYDPRVYSHEIDVAVVAGVVTLRGDVTTVSARRAAEADARSTLGVTRVRNMIEVEPEVVRKDLDVKADVRAALLRHPALQNDILHVHVKNGVVQLFGKVDSILEKADADDLTARVDGVLWVTNHLVVRDPELMTFHPWIDDYDFTRHAWYRTIPAALPAQSDAAIADAVKDELMWSPFVPAENIEIEVQDGVVILSGEVDSWSQWQAARKNALDAGAVRVRNRLEIHERTDAGGS